MLFRLLAFAFAFLLHEVAHFVHMEKRSGPLWYLVAFPVAGALVTALRETSIVFALLIGVFVLKERLSLLKVASTMTTLLGAVLLRFAR